MTTNDRNTLLVQALEWINEEGHLYIQMSGLALNRKLMNEVSKRSESARSILSSARLAGLEIDEHGRCIDKTAGE